MGFPPSGGPWCRAPPRPRVHSLGGPLLRAGQALQLHQAHPEEERGHDDGGLEMKGPSSKHLANPPSCQAQVVGAQGQSAATALGQPPHQRADTSASGGGIRAGCDGHTEEGTTVPGASQTALRVSSGGESREAGRRAEGTAQAERAGQRPTESRSWQRVQRQAEAGAQKEDASGQKQAHVTSPRA